MGRKCESNEGRFSKLMSFVDDTVGAVEGKPKILPRCKVPGGSTGSENRSTSSKVELELEIPLSPRGVEGTTGKTGRMPGDMGNRDVPIVVRRGVLPTERKGSY